MRKDYYNSSSDYDVIDVIKAFDLNFNLGNVLKYIARQGRKEDSIADLQKAREYIDREIKYQTQDAVGYFLSKEEMLLLHEKANEFQIENPLLRRGQVLVSSLYEINKNLYMKITNSQYDPFFNNELIPEFLKYIQDE